MENCSLNIHSRCINYSLILLGNALFSSNKHVQFQITQDCVKTIIKVIVVHTQKKRLCNFEWRSVGQLWKPLKKRTLLIGLNIRQVKHCSNACLCFTFNSALNNHSDAGGTCSVIQALLVDFIQCYCTPTKDCIDSAGFN